MDDKIMQILNYLKKNGMHKINKKQEFTKFYKIFIDSFYRQSSHQNFESTIGKILEIQPFHEFFNTISTDKRYNSSSAKKVLLQKQDKRFNGLIMDYYMRLLTQIHLVEDILKTFEIKEDEDVLLRLKTEMSSSELESIMNYIGNTPIDNKDNNIIDKSKDTEYLIDNNIINNNISKDDNIKDDIDNISKDDIDNISKDDIDNISKDDIDNISKDNNNNKDNNKDDKDNNKKDDTNNISKDYNKDNNNKDNISKDNNNKDNINNNNTNNSINDDDSIFNDSIFNDSIDSNNKKRGRRASTKTTNKKTKINNKEKINIVKYVPYSPEQLPLNLSDSQNKNEIPRRNTKLNKEKLNVVYKENTKINFSDTLKRSRRSK